VPAHVTALVLADTPATKLTCTARSEPFAVAGKTVERGVISHYAASTLAAATTASDWLSRIQEAVRRDGGDRKTATRASLQIKLAGTGSQLLPGKPILSR
jgi:hypothetical protein